MHTLATALLALTPLAASSQDAVVPERQTRVVRFYGLKGDVELKPVRDALLEHSADLIYGPRNAPSKKGRHFVAVESPADLKAKEVATALKKGGARVEELAVTCFEGRVAADSALPEVFGLGPRDHILGMSSDIRWYSSSGGWSQFYGPPRKLAPDDLQERFEKLYAPFGGGTLGEVARETFAWKLAAPIDERAARKAEKKLVKLQGIVAARIDAASGELHFEVELAGLNLSGPPRAFPGSAEDGSPPRITFATNPLLDLLLALGIRPAGS